MIHVQSNYVVELTVAYLFFMFAPTYIHVHICLHIYIYCTVCYLYHTQNVGGVGELSIYQFIFRDPEAAVEGLGD